MLKNPQFKFYDLLKTKVLFITVFVFLAIGFYWIRFYKSYQSNQIHQNANQVLILDKKEIAKTFFLSRITTPSQWKSLPDSLHSRGVNNLGLKIQDFICFFSLSRSNGVFLSTQIIDEERFLNTLNYFGFLSKETSQGWTKYWHKEYSIKAIRFKNNILISNYESLEAVQGIAHELYIKNKTFDIQEWKTIRKKIHHSLFWVKKNELLVENTYFPIKIKKNSIILSSDFLWNREDDSQFFPNHSGLASVNFSLSREDLNWMGSTTQKRIETFVGFSLDSLLKNGSQKIYLNLNGGEKKTVKTVSYEFDENFNETEVDKIDTILQPNFSVTMKSRGSKKLYSYLKNSAMIDSAGVFTNNPLAETYTMLSDSSLIFHSQGNQIPSNQNSDTKHIATISVTPREKDSVFLQSLPFNNRWLNFLDKMNSFHFILKQNGKNASLQATILCEKDQSWFFDN